MGKKSRAFSYDEEILEKIKKESAQEQRNVSQIANSRIKKSYEEHEDFKEVME